MEKVDFYTEYVGKDLILRPFKSFVCSVASERETELVARIIPLFQSEGSGKTRLCLELLEVLKCGWYCIYREEKNHLMRTPASTFNAPELSVNTKIEFFPTPVQINVRAPESLYKRIKAHLHALLYKNPDYFEAVKLAPFPCHLDQKPSPVGTLNSR